MLILPAEYKRTLGSGLNLLTKTPPGMHIGERITTPSVPLRGIKHKLIDRFPSIFKKELDLLQVRAVYL